MFALDTISPSRTQKHIRIIRKYMYRYRTCTLLASIMSLGPKDNNVRLSVDIAADLGQQGYVLKDCVLKLHGLDEAELSNIII